MIQLPCRFEKRCLKNMMLKYRNNAVYIAKSRIDETLAVQATAGKKLLEPFKSFAASNRLPFNILEDHQVTDNDAEVHQHEADLWLCLEGEVIFVCDGEMENPWFKKLPDGSEDRREIKAKSIRGGTTYVLKSGDWLWIPAGVPHQHNTPGTARLVIIKIPNLT